jgi:SAM-dependent methyltransferase
MSHVPESPESLVAEVRQRYGRIASGEVSGCGCSCNDAPAGVESALSRGIGYADGDLAAIPEEANLGLGCGAPLAGLALAPGETVLDLGSGAGMDAFLAARQVGATGRVIGVDMTPEMIDRARAAAAKHGFANVEFRRGRLEQLPVDDASVDAVTSNCVFNLVPDKPAVFREVARVLKPGGRIVVSDILLDRPLPEAMARDLLAWVGCVAGAELREPYFAAVAAAGLGEIEILRDADYGATFEAAAPEQAAELLSRSGVDPAAVRGTIRSITWRARKPA